MRRIPAILLSAALAAASHMAINDCSVADDTRELAGGLGQSIASSEGEIDAIRQRLRHWDTCLPMSRDTPAFCRDGGGEITLTMHWVVKRILDADMNELLPLCIIDVMIVRSQDECLAHDPKDPYSNVVPLADLMIDLGGRWARFGAKNRAAQLYSQANDLMAAAFRDSPYFQLSPLPPWIELEIDRGRLWRALQLAERQTMLERQVYNVFPDSVLSLIDALHVEARILDRLGRTEEARAKEQEADAFAATAR